VQGGKQLEILTGGHIEAGYHEVVCAPETLTAIEKARESGTYVFRVSLYACCAVSCVMLIARRVPNTRDTHTHTR
jgi:hypothetical protein